MSKYVAQSHLKLLGNDDKAATQNSVQFARRSFSDTAAKDRAPCMNAPENELCRQTLRLASRYSRVFCRKIEGKPSDFITGNRCSLTLTHQSTAALASGRSSRRIARDEVRNPSSDQGHRPKPRVGSIWGPPVCLGGLPALPVPHNLSAI